MTLTDRLYALIDKLEPEMRKSFLGAISFIVDQVVLRRLVSALETGNIEQVYAALNLENAAFSGMVQIQSAAYAQGGALAASTIKRPSRVTFLFDMTNPAAENWLRQKSSQMITGLVAEEKVSIQQAITAAYQQGYGPQAVAKQLVGVKTSTGRRTGGLIGLSEPQKRYAASMRSRLLSGDPAEMRKVLSGLTLRDKRFDKTIKKYIALGKPVPRDMVDRMVSAYSNRLLKRRSEDIARTEIGQAVMQSRSESFRQLLDKERLPPEAITKVWRSGPEGAMARPSHRAMNKVRVVGLYTPFRFEAKGGTVLKQYALDGNGGAAHDANCRCDTLFEVDWTYGL